LICSIHQPSYFPWLGLLDKIAKTDLFILLDNAQLSKGTFQYRNIFLCEGKAKYLTLPLEIKLGSKFHELKFKNDKWRGDHLNRLSNYYCKSPFFDELYPLLQDFYSEPHDNPIDCLEASMSFCFKHLAIDVELIRSSTLSVNGVKAEMVLNLCLAVGASDYLAGMGSFDYMQSHLDRFKREGVNVHWHDFAHPQYKQNIKHEFEPGLSSLDLFFYAGISEGRDIFWNNVRRALVKKAPC
jgi:hypothetical protein